MRLKAVALDVDGTLTDGKFWWGPNGEEFKQFSFADVMGISLGKKAGLRFALISGENSPLVDRFAEKMGIVDVYKGCKDKATALRAFMERRVLQPEEVAFMGDDVNDLPAMRLVGLSAAPANSVPKVQAEVGVVTQRNGGDGAVRELLDRLLDADLDPTVAFPNTTVTTLQIQAANAFEKGDAALAADRFRRAIELAPNAAENHFNLGLVLRSLGRWADAADALRRAVALNPNDAEFQAQLGNTLVHLDLEEAVRHLKQAVTLEPRLAQAWLDLIAPLGHLGRFEEANLARSQVELMNPELYRTSGARALGELGKAFAYRSRFEEAVATIQRAVGLRDDSPESRRTLAEAQTILGFNFQHGGRVEEALAWYERAIACDPTYPVAHSHRLWCLQFSDGHTAEEIRDLTIEWAETYAPLSLARNPRLQPGKRPLRIGYVSPEFRNHPVAYYLEPMLRAHDRERFQAFLYSNLAFPEDATTARLRALADGWRDIQGLTDDQAADLIQADGIDILIDLAGHTENNRIGVFARKPAPIQAQWLYYATTGMPQMDYYLGDARLVPESEESLYVERVLRLSNTAFGFQYPEDALAVSPLPALTRGHVTFGCHNYLAKANAEVVRVWSEVLKAVPDSRMVLNRHAFVQPTVREWYLDLFAAHGVSANRIDLIATNTREEYLASLGDLDVFLDTFPYGGFTSAYDALWMGLPVVTMAAPRTVGHFSESLVAPLGHPDWVAHSPAEYVAAAVALSRDLPQLARIRAELRPALLASPLCDAATGTRELELLFLQMVADAAPLALAS